MIAGSMVALVTPMDAQGGLDWDSLSKLVDFHLQEGTNAIVAVGTTGESATLSVAEHIEVMIAAVVVAIGVMFVASEPLAHFIERNPTTKMLALTFLMLIGMALVADGFQFHIPRQYIYFAMGFSVFVEMINLRVRKGTAPVKLHSAYVEEAPKK